jgi:4-alpha-glucanotransferase
VGVHPDGYDLWRYKDVFALGASAGAPPDPYFPNGQNWGFPPLHPDVIRRRGYQYFIDMLRFQMRHAGLLRVDHIMGLHRLYWIPPGMPPSMGAYVSYPAEEFYAILSLESHRHQTVIAGENLGTVPSQVTEFMVRHHVRETYVAQYEQRPNPTCALRPPPSPSVASVNTHDMPPFVSHWSAADIQQRVELNLFSKGKVRNESVARRSLNLALRQFLIRNGLLERAQQNCEAVLRACLEWLARSEAEYVLINLEDLWAEPQWQNVPGTTNQHPNWRRKARLDLEQIRGSTPIREFLQSIAKLRALTGKTHGRPDQRRGQARSALQLPLRHRKGKPAAQ